MTGQTPNPAETDPKTGDPATNPTADPAKGGTTNGNDAEVLKLFGGITDETPIDALPDGLRDYIKGLRTEAKTARETERAKQAEKLKAAGEWEKLATQHETNLKTATEQLESEKKQARALAKALKDFNASRVAAMPEADRVLVPESDDPIFVSEWLNKYAARTAATSDKGGGNGKGATNGAGAGAGNGNGKEKPKQPPMDAGAQGLKPEEIADAAKQAAAQKIRLTNYRM